MVRSEWEQQIDDYHDGYPKRYWEKNNKLTYDDLLGTTKEKKSKEEQDKWFKNYLENIKWKRI